MCGDHLVLMMGDTFASTIETAIENLSIPKPIPFEAVKVSHHGSNGNLSKSLLGKFKSHRFFIPGGKGSKYPSIKTLGRIAESNKDEFPKQIVFSHNCTNSEKIHNLSDEDKASLGIETSINEEEYELFEW